MGSVVYTTNVTAGCLPMKPEIPYQPYGPPWYVTTGLLNFYIYDMVAGCR